MSSRPARRIDILQLEIVLRYADPRIWRRIEVAGDTTFADLHRTLQVTMGWQDSHLHEFQVGDVTYGLPNPEFGDDRAVKDERRVRLGRVLEAGKELTYEYDFGDGWVHDILVEERRAAEPGARYPRVLEGARACPPEDVGGVGGYEEFLAALGNPRHPEHRHMLEWIGGRFDPEWFDAAAIDRVLGFARGISQEV